MVTAHVLLYATSSGGTVKVKSDIARIKALLDAKRVQYEEVDLAMEPLRRAAMLAGSEGVTRLPQLHINGRYIGTSEDIQELEDWGELNGILQGLSPEQAAAAAAAAAAGISLAASAAPAPEVPAVPTATSAAREGVTPVEGADTVGGEVPVLAEAQAAEDLQLLAAGVAASAAANALATASGEEEAQQQIAAAAAAQEEREFTTAASDLAAAAVAKVLAVAEAEERLAAVVAAAFAPHSSPPTSAQAAPETSQQPAAPAAGVQPDIPLAAHVPGRNAAAAAAVAAIQASANDIIERALKAARRLDTEAQQGPQAALQLAAEELPSPDANTTQLICSPIKLRPELQQLAGGQPF